MAGAGFVRATSGVALNRDQALIELAKAAHDVLLEVASTYRATITYDQLGVEAQKRAGVRAGRTPGWVADMLAMVVRVTHRLAEPPLTALVVGPDGAVGTPYDEVARTAGLPAFADGEAREWAAAASRLDSYRRYAPGVPEDAVPTLVTSAAATRTARLRTPRTASGHTQRVAGGTRPSRVAAPKRRDPDVNVAAHVLCSSCFIQTPPGAECQNCGASLR